MEFQADSSTDFLANSRYQSHKEIPKEIQNQLENNIANLTRTELQKIYKREYSSWKNRKRSCKTGEGEFSTDWNDFTDFLLSIGPAPPGKMSLDRIDNGNPNYGPGLCRWACPQVQNSNKSNNVYIEYKGEIETVAYWATKTEIPRATLYRRKKNGWSDREVIEGKREEKTTTSSRPWPEDNHELWERQFLSQVQREPMGPLQFLAERSIAAIKRLRDFSDSIPPDPETGKHPEEIADYIHIATNLWIARYELAQTNISYTRWEAKAKRLSSSGIAQISMKELHQLNPQPDISQFHKLTGDLPHQRPAAFTNAYPP